MSLSSARPVRIMGCSALRWSCTSGEPESEEGEKGTPVFLYRRSGKIIEGFGEFASALRKKNTGGIEFIGGLRSGKQCFLEMPLFTKLRGARFAMRDVALNLLALLIGRFAAGVENQKRRNVFAAHVFFKNAHRRPPNSLRSLRVARKSEFFTVSSVVPRASPIARSFR